MLAQTKLPFPFNAINRIGEISNRLGCMTLMFDATDIEQRASKATGLHDFGDPHYRLGLEAFLDAARHGPLNYLGRLTADSVALEYAKTRLEWVEIQKRQPEAFAAELTPPIILTGMPRSGTTLLHRLLAALPTNQAIPQWRLLKPFPPLDGGKDTRHTDIRHVYQTAQKMRPTLATKHDISADTPEECMIVQGISFNSFILYASVPAYRYFNWYAAASRDVMYTEYASILHWYQSQDARRLVMKSPSHMSDLRALLAAVPNALIVQTHRDPVNVVNSLNSLIHTLHTPFMQPYVPAQMVETNLRIIDMMVQGNLAARDVLQPNICDVFYDELVREPIGTVKKIYTHFALAWDESYAERLAAYLAENPQGKHGAHRYSSADFGLTDTQIREHCADYVMHFDL